MSFFLPNLALQFVFLDIMSSLLCKQLQMALRASVVIDSSSVQGAFQWVDSDYRGLLSNTGTAITKEIFSTVLLKKKKKKMFTN